MRAKSSMRTKPPKTLMASKRQNMFKKLKEVMEVKVGKDVKEVKVKKC